jgi:competence protein ComEC
MQRSVQIMGGVIVVLFFICSGIWYAVVREDAHGILTVSFLNVGQGDAIFIRAPSGRMVLIDGGPDASVLRELGRVLPWYSHSIDVVIPTHPDLDHISGLIDVLDRYHVSHIVQSSVEGNTPQWHTLENKIVDAQSRGSDVHTALRGEVVDLGGGAYLEILSPDRNVPHVATNEGCVVTRLVYGHTSFMLPCDAPQDIENYLVSLDGSTSLTTGGHHLHSDVLKAGHHGSRTSSALAFVGYVSPSYVLRIPASRNCCDDGTTPDPHTRYLYRRHYHFHQ